MHVPSDLAHSWEFIQQIYAHAGAKLQVYEVINCGKRSKTKVPQREPG